jgi:predicted DNA-binding transcriptional regulator AlpA
VSTSKNRYVEQFESNDYVSIKQAAELAKVGETSIRRALTSGKIVGTTSGSSNSMVHRPSLNSWIVHAQLARGRWQDEQSCSVRVAAQLAGCSDTIIHNAARAGLLVASQTAQGYWLIDRESLQRWLSEKPPAAAELHGEFMSTEDANKLSGIAIHRLHRAINRGELEAVRVRTGVGQHPFRIPVAAFNGWLLNTSPRFDTTRLRGELVSLEEAARRLGLNAEVLGRNVKRGRLPSARGLGPGQPYVLGMEDVTAWVQARCDIREGKAWVLDRVSRFTGLERHRLVRSIQSKELLASEVPNPAGGRPRYRFEPSALRSWIQQHCPAYSKESAGLSAGLSVNEVSTQSGLSESAVLAAIEAEELEALGVPEGDTIEWIISRCAFDRWCKGLGIDRSRSPLVTISEAESISGLSPTILYDALKKDQLRGVVGRGRGARSWIERRSLEEWVELYGRKGDERYVTVPEAARLSSHAVPTIQLAITKGHIEAVRAPTRKKWLVVRDSLQLWMEQLPSPTALRAERSALSVTDSARQAGVSSTLINKAIRDGKIEALIARGFGGPVYQVLPESLERWIEQRRKLSLDNLEDGRMSIAEAARRCGLTKSVLSAAIWQGKLQVDSLNGLRGRQYVVSQQVLDQWLDQRGATRRRKAIPVSAPL